MDRQGEPARIIEIAGHALGHFREELLDEVE
jgi:hypothetical protein